MIVFGCCIASEEKFHRFAVPGLKRCAEPDSPVVETSHDFSIFEAYNEILDHYVSDGQLEALVLLHEDTEIRDPKFCDKVRGSLSDRSLAVLGVIGARSVAGLRWWEGDGHGRVEETRGLIDFGRQEADVDAVDGLLLVLSPWAVRNLRFDAQSFGGFHAYDIDFCFSARSHGKRVRTLDVDVFHHTKGGYGDQEGFERSNAIFQKKWKFRDTSFLST